MRQVLHILTATADPLAGEILELEAKSSELHTQVIDLTEPEPDYDALVQALFKADSIQVW